LGWSLQIAIPRNQRQTNLEGVLTKMDDGTDIRAKDKAKQP